MRFVGFCTNKLVQLMPSVKDTQVGFGICHPGKDPGDHGCSLAMAHARRQSFIFMVQLTACRSKCIVFTKRLCMVILK